MTRRAVLRATSLVGLVCGLCLAEAPRRSWTVHMEPANPGPANGPWAGLTTTVKTQTEADVAAVVQSTREASCFFAFLAETNALPALPRGTLKSFGVDARSRVSSGKYPVQMRVDVTPRDAAAAKQQYWVEQRTAGALWRLVQGWSLGPEGRRAAELPLAPEALQREANAALPGMLSRVKVERR